MSFAVSRTFFAIFSRRDAATPKRVIKNPISFSERQFLNCAAAGRVCKRSRSSESNLPQRRQRMERSRFEFAERAGDIAEGGTIDTKPAQRHFEPHRQSVVMGTRVLLAPERPQQRVGAVEPYGDVPRYGIDGIGCFGTQRHERGICQLGWVELFGREPPHVACSGGEPRVGLAL